MMKDKSGEDKSSWENRRIGEMEEKADAPIYPSHDMDGLRFQPELTETEYLRQEDAYDASLSERFKDHCGLN